MVSVSIARSVVLSAAFCAGLVAVCGTAIAQTAQAAGTQAGEAASKRGAWGDRRDGTYVNPVLPGDFSDLDAIRVGRDYYAVSSTMQYAPGMAVLHSRDLVNWQIIGHAVADLTSLDPALGWQSMHREGRGIWAGALRRHAGRFRLFFGTPDGGIYSTTAVHAQGPWTAPKLVLAGAGWDDPCPFWDEDGQAYLIATRFAEDRDGQRYRIHLMRMAADGGSVDQATDRVVHQSPGSEANKLYKIDGMYLHFFSEVKAEGRVAMMERARSLDGPWEVRQLNHVDPARDKEPNQGGLLQAADGRWWFLTHQGTGAWEGRAAALLPVTWLEGWPVIGKPGRDTIGEMVWAGRKPVSGFGLTSVFADDDFDETQLRPEWEWRYQPRPGMWSLSGGSLRLQAFGSLHGKGFQGAGDVLTQRSARAARAEVTVRMDLDNFVDGQEGGLAHFAGSASRLAVIAQGDVRRVERVEQTATGETTRVPGPVVRGQSIWLRTGWDVRGMAWFAYSLDGSDFVRLGGLYRMSWAAYRGDRVGLYTFAGGASGGSAAFRRFRYTVAR